MVEYFTIGQVAEFANISVKTLRHYDKIGLLKPSFCDTKTNYRYYTNDQFYNLYVISYLKSFNLSLGEISELINSSNDLSSIIAFLENQKIVIDNQLSSLKKASKSLNRKISQLKEKSKVDFTSNVTYKNIPNRTFSYINTVGISSFSEINHSMRKFVEFILKSFENSSGNVEIDQPIALTFDFNEYINNRNIVCNQIGSIDNVEFVFDSRIIKTVIPEGKYINTSSKFTQESLSLTLENIVEYIVVNNIQIEKTIYVVFNGLDPSVSLKDYIVEFQIKTLNDI